MSPSGFHDSNSYPDTSEVKEDQVASFISNRYATIARGQLDDFKEPSKFKGWDTKYEELLKYKGFARALISTTKNNYSLIKRLATARYLNMLYGVIMITYYHLIKSKIKFLELCPI